LTATSIGTTLTTTDSLVTNSLNASATPITGSGSINNVIIGNSTPAAGTFSSFASNGIDDNATSTAITIDSSEQVGIGTATPSHLLDIESSSSAVALRVHSTSGIDSSNPKVRVEGITTGIFENVGGAAGGTKISQDGGSSLLFKSNNDIVVSGSLTSATAIGVGTSSPSEDLHVKETSTGISSSPKVLIEGTGGSLSNSAILELNAGGSTGALTMGSSAISASVTFSQGSSGININDLTNGIVLYTAGSVGTPDVKVDTSGNVNMANNLTVEGGTVKLTGSLPTSDPSVAGQLWNDSGTLKISAG